MMKKGRSMKICAGHASRIFEPGEMMACGGWARFPVPPQSRCGRLQLRQPRYERCTSWFSNPALLAKVVDKPDKIPMDDRDTKGDVYEYMLGMMIAAPVKRLFAPRAISFSWWWRWPSPRLRMWICDPFRHMRVLVAAAEYLRKHHPEMLRDTDARKHFSYHVPRFWFLTRPCCGLVRMNMGLLHGVEDPLRNIVTVWLSRNIMRMRENTAFSSCQSAPCRDLLIMRARAADLQKIVKPTEDGAVVLALFLRLMKQGGRAAVCCARWRFIGSIKRPTKRCGECWLMNITVAVINMPWVFRPYSNVSLQYYSFTKLALAVDLILVLYMTAWWIL